MLEDRLGYTVLSHTDLSRENGRTIGNIDLSTLNWGNFDLVVIDESHNFRNNTKGKRDEDGNIIKKSRYAKLLDDIINSGITTKVLMLSATPVNNNLKDLRNQLYFISGGKEDAFSERTGIKNLALTIKNAQTIFTHWADPKKNSARNVTDLLEKLDSSFFKLLDALTIARSRKHIETYYKSEMERIGAFPKRLPVISKAPEIDIEDEFPSYDRINNEIMTYKLSLFNPAAYVKKEHKAYYEEKADKVVAAFSQENREYFLIGMMKINFLKRLESSIKSFEISMERTINKIAALEKRIKEYRKHPQTELNFEAPDINESEDEELNEANSIGKKLKYKLDHLDLTLWLEDLKSDKDALVLLKNAATVVTADRDKKLWQLKNIIKNKIETPLNKGNKKVIIFTAFSDTAEYLHHNLKEYVIKELNLHIALITGSGTNKTSLGKNNFNHILTNFSPISKNRDKIREMPQDEEIDILIATDCISEGQNLQDCDYLVNYDIHWNPVRIIQRFGRIDRLGSKNNKIQLMNFWPTNDLNNYINLKDRVEARMALVDITATGEENLLESDQLHDLIEEDLKFRNRQLKKLQKEVLDLEELDENISLSEFTLDDFRIELSNYIEKNRHRIENSPLGIYAVVPSPVGLYSKMGKYKGISETIIKIIKPGVIYCLKQNGNTDDNETINPLSPYFLVYIRDDNTVRFNYTHPKQILEIFRLLSNGKDIPYEKLCDIFNSETDDGSNMVSYNKLLKTANEFEKNFLDQNNKIADLEKFKTKAQTDNWKRIELLFQLTDVEMNSQGDIFDTGKFDNAIINAYLFFAIELKSNHYNRTGFSNITRQINRVFSMPVMLIVKYDNNITLSIIKRRLHKIDESRDVLEKVTLIKDINTIKPHRAHIEILFDLSLEELRKKHSVSNFVELQKAWQKTLDYSELNKKFYSEIANWYFWAIENIEFPDDLEKNPDIRNATAAIRLLTRLIFVWFIKEKSVIPEALFQKKKLKQILKDFTDPGSSDATIFYKAILQNLFFATLSTEKDKRKFRGKKWVNGRNIDFGNQYVYRYEKLVSDVDRWKALFADILFLNGGLFENLDNKKKRIMVDGFSEEKRNYLNVPDFLFFSTQRNIDLNKTFDTKGKNYKVKGLLEILNNYKFTIAENTPIEEEIALDPELLGKVFENLLASFNPETKTTARKQTGSFYTPREIVDYMVDENLKVSFSRMVSCKLENTTSEDIKIGLDILFAYTEKEHAFNDIEVKQIVKAISEVKILDPACGSGAFPMGILHKLVFILTKLNPDNIFWRELQKQRAIKETENAYNLGKQKERQTRIKEIEETFNSNTSDYGRKLFLIENAIYGVDIQPIAVQIAKLRFFISLIVDQDMKNNIIIPLPNLETKFVAADTLIGGKKKELSQLDLFDNRAIEKFEDELKTIRYKYFNARNPIEKLSLRKQDKRIREKIADLVKKSGGNETIAKRLISWDPYDQNHAASFFDNEWMYGIIDGFDIVIGNLSYVPIQKFSGKQEQKNWENENYKTFVKTGDIYCLFYEKGNMLLKDGGALAFISSNKWMRTNYGKATRKYFLKSASILQLIDFGDSQIFENATTYTNILISCKGKTKNQIKAWDLSKGYKSNSSLEAMLQENTSCESILNENSFVIIPTEQASIKKRIEEIGTPLKDWDISIYRGILTGFNEAFIISSEKKDELIAKDPKTAEIIKPILRGRDIKKYKTEFADLWLINSHNGFFDNESQKRVSPINIDTFPAIKDHLDNYRERVEKRQDKGITPYNLRNCAYLKEFENKKIIWIEMSPTSNFTYSSTTMFILNTGYIMTGNNLKYFLAVVNSSLLSWYFPFISTDVRGNTRRYLKQYVDNFPIPKIPKEKQFPFEALVDCILFAKENGMESESDRIQSIIDLMVFDLYFEKEMKKKDCYITDYITEKIQAFKPDDTDEFKKEYIKAFYTFTSKDKNVFRCLKFAHHLVKPVRIIMEQKNG
ncbi:MAG: Eco57I restriction-modification methylase domain-containing protein [Desulfobacula sp.]|nr:Eco57I restriction-modification methylase domain-containing protein [Desulfobacula sp.]